MQLHINVPIGTLVSLRAPLEMAGSLSVPAEKQERERTGRGPKVRYQRLTGEPSEPIIVVFPDDADGIEVLERCFKRHGMTCSPESAARADAVLASRKELANPKPWYLQEQKQKARKRKS